MRNKALQAMAVASLLAGCGGGGGSTPSAPAAPPAPPPAARAVLTVDITPTSPVAQPSGEPAFPWRVTWTIALRETAGLGANVNFVDVSFVNSFGFETPGALNIGASQITQLAGTNHIPARGQLLIPLGITYRADGFGGRSITLKNAISITDDRGNNMNLGATATVVSRESVRF